MTTLHSWKGDGLGAGALTTGSVGTGDTAWSTITGAPTIVATGPRSPQINFPATSSIARLAKNFTAVGQLGCTWYENRSGYAGGTVALVQGLNTGQTVQSFRIEMTSTGTLVCRDAANAVSTVSSTGTVPTGTYMRCALVIDSSGNITFTVYNGHTSTQLARVTGTGATTHDAVRVGTAAAPASQPTYDVDDFTFTDVASDPGPAVVVGTDWVVNITDAIGIIDNGSTTATDHVITIADIIGITDATVRNLVAGGSGGDPWPGNDALIAILTAGGYVSGTIMDRERARLLAKTGIPTPGVGYTLQDLYRVANERPRLT